MFNIKIVWRGDCPSAGTVKVSVITHKCMVIILLPFEKYSRSDDQSPYLLEKNVSSLL